MSLLTDLYPDLHSNDLVCLIGAGGKTSVMFNLASAQKKMGKKVLVTTTTKIYPPENKQCDTVIFGSQPSPDRLKKIPSGTITCLGKALRRHDNKVIGLDKGYVDHLFDSQVFDCILTEGDGAGRKGIKAPKEGEPVVPEKTTLALGIIGLDTIGKQLNDEHVYQSDRFCTITGANKNDRINEHHIARLILSKNGLFKNVPESCKRIVLLNKADTLPDLKAPCRIRRIVAEKAPCIRIAAISARLDRVMPW